MSETFSTPFLLPVLFIYYLFVCFSPYYFSLPEIIYLASSLLHPPIRLRRPPPSPNAVDETTADPDLGAAASSRAPPAAGARREPPPTAAAPQAFARRHAGPRGSCLCFFFVGKGWGAVPFVRGILIDFCARAIGPRRLEF